MSLQEKLSFLDQNNFFFKTVKIPGSGSKKPKIKVLIMSGETLSKFEINLHLESFKLFFFPYLSLYIFFYKCH